MFHPRGFAIALVFDDQGVATGWQLMGDGTERWTFDENDPGPVDECFTAAEKEFAEAMLKSLKKDYQ